MDSSYVDGERVPSSLQNRIPGALGTYDPATYKWTASRDGVVRMYINLALFTPDDGTNGPRLNLIAQLEKNGTVLDGLTKCGYLRKNPAGSTYSGGFQSSLYLSIVERVKANDVFRVIVKGEASLNKPIYLTNDMSHWTCVLSTEAYTRLSSVNTSTDVNTDAWSVVPFDTLVHQNSNPYVVFDASSHSITVKRHGTYRLAANVSLHSTVKRAAPEMAFRLSKKNGTTVYLVGRSACGYIRDHDGHNESSLHLTTLVSLDVSDAIEIVARRTANSGTVTLTENQSVWTVEPADVLYAAYTTSDTSTSYHVTDWTPVSWTSVLEKDTAILREEDTDGTTSHTKRTVQRTGFYAFHVTLGFVLNEPSEIQRTNIICRLRRTDPITQTSDYLIGEGKQGYIRNTQNHTTASVHLSTVAFLRACDIVEVIVKKEEVGRTNDPTVTLLEDACLWIVEMLGGGGPPHEIRVMEGNPD
ncbi:MAG: hypothetical protein ABEI52_04975, partial [Halobacteriaceae archaeon]